MKNKLKFLVAIAVLAGFTFSSFRTEAYPPFVKKAAKFGAENCLFCHKEANGGEGWNDRGNWLIAEKDKRKADSIDVEWLADYKPEGEKKEGDPKEGEKKPEEKKPEEKKPPQEISATPAPSAVSSTSAEPAPKVGKTTAKSGKALTKTSLNKTKKKK